MTRTCESDPPEKGFLVWLPRTSPPLRENDTRSPIERAGAPLAHFSRQWHLADRVRSGDTLWFVRAAPDPLTPSLDARILVSRVSNTGTGVRLDAGAGSCWFGWNDASDLLAEARFWGRGPKVDMSRPLGQQLRTVRELKAATADEFTARGRDLTKRPRLFVSYRWSESGEVAAQVAQAAAAVGFAPWIDRWSAPRRLAEGREATPSRALSQMLRNTIAECAAAILIETPGYHSSKWTRIERNAIFCARLPHAIMKPAEALTATASMEQTRSLLMTLWDATRAASD